MKNDSRICDRKVNNRKISNRKINDRKINNRKVNDRKINNRKVNNRKINDRKINDRKVNNRKKSDSKADNINDNKISGKEINNSKTNSRKISGKKLLRYLRPYRFLIILELLLSIITVLLSLTLPILIGQAVDQIGLLKENSSPAPLLRLLTAMAGAAAAAALIQWLANLLSQRIVYRVVRDIRKQAFEKLESLPLSYLDSHSHGDILSRIINDIDQFTDGLLMGFTQIFTGVMTILGTLVFMLRVNVAITAVVVILTPMSLFAANFISRRTFKMFKLQSETRGEQTALINEMIGGRLVVQAYGREDAVKKRFNEIDERLGKCSLRAVFYSSLTNPCTRFVNNLVYAGVGLAGAFSVLNGVLSVGRLTVFLAYANQYTKPFNEISEVIAELQNALAGAARVFELLEAESEVKDRETAVQLEPPVGNVALEQVHFSYRAEQKLIADFNLQVKRGQRVAIVGPTGCGKTTVINLLLRFYDVDRGRIMVEGCDIRSVKRGALRQAYGMVLQETWLRGTTIRENIIMGKPEATEAEMIAAARATHAHSFIRRLPEGYGTVLDEDGGNLSQGQKQLLCITRVMLCLPPMLILDEATSSIDTRTEIRIGRAFTLMMEGRTSFIIAHRLTTIRSADVILVMKDGRIIEQGRHEELLAAGGFYRELYNSQFTGINQENGVKTGV